MNYISPLVLGIVSALACMPALAQSNAAPFDGDWSVIMKGTALPTTPELALTVKGTTGTFTNPRANKSNKCGSLKAPLEEVVQDETRLEFAVYRSKLLTGCEDFRIKFVSQDGKLVGESFVITPAGEAKSPVTFTATKR